MRISQLIDTPLVLLGFGVEGQATLAALRRAGHRAPVTLIGDSPPAEELLSGADALFTSEPAQALHEGVTLIRSPGFAPHHPLRRLADKMNVVQTTATDLFMHEARAAGLTVVGVTGSKGKSTTSTLIERGLKAAGRSAVLVGNIGIPPLAMLEQAVEQGAVVVTELSSYQCADLTLGPSIGLLLVLFPEHMDWHGDVDQYYRAKLRMLEAQRAGDRYFYAQSCADRLASLSTLSQGTAVGDEAGFHFRDGSFYQGTKRLFSDEGMTLRGLHNRQNACFALAVLDALGAELRAVPSVLRSFLGLPYRLQDEGVHYGVRFINDSISTAPEATVAALAAYDGGAIALIVGGHDRGYEMAPLLAALAARPIFQIIALPKTGHALARQLRTAGIDTPVVEVQEIGQAVDVAFRCLPKGGLCLFSPGAPSYGMFRNFAERGECFSEAVRTGRRGR